MAGSEVRPGGAASGHSCHGNSDSELHCWGITCSEYRKKYLYWLTAGTQLTWVFWLAVGVPSCPPSLKGKKWVYCGCWPGLQAFTFSNVEEGQLCHCAAQPAGPSGLSERRCCWGRSHPAKLLPVLTGQIRGLDEAKWDLGSNKDS